LGCFAATQLALQVQQVTDDSGLTRESKCVTVQRGSVIP